MWGHQQEPPATKSAPKATDHAPTPPEGLPVPPADDLEPEGRIGAGLRIKGAVVGDSDVYVDGEIEGSLTLPENALIVGPNGRVRAQVKARTLILWGHLEGNVQATEKIEIRQSGSLLGDLVTPQILIEEGAAFRGDVDILKPETSEKTRPPAGNSTGA